VSRWTSRQFAREDSAEISRRKRWRGGLGDGARRLCAIETTWRGSQRSLVRRSFGEDGQGSASMKSLRGFWPTEAYAERLAFRWWWLIVKYTGAGAGGEAHVEFARTAAARGGPRTPAGPVRLAGPHPTSGALMRRPEGAIRLAQYQIQRPAPPEVRPAAESRCDRLSRGADRLPRASDSASGQGSSSPRAGSVRRRRPGPG